MANLAPKYLFYLGFGTLIVLIGTIIAGAGAFRSVMADPTEDGPLMATQNVYTAGAAFNERHYVAVVAYFPEIFDCDNLRDIYQLTTTDAELLGDHGTKTQTGAYAYAVGNIATNEDIRDAAVNLCWTQSARQAWIYALFLPLLVIFLVLAFIAAFRKSGYQAAIAGVGLSSVMLAYCAAVIAHYQIQSSIPIVLDAFGDCDDFIGDRTSVTYKLYHQFNTGLVDRDSTVSALIDTTQPNLVRGFADNYPLALPQANLANFPANNARISTYFSLRGSTNHHREMYTTTGAGATVRNWERSPSRVFGPVPKRSWLCADDWDYDGRFQISANLLYGGTAVAAFGLLWVLVSFASIAFPFLKVIPNKSANQQQKTAPLTRSADVVVEDEYTYTYSE